MAVRQHTSFGVWPLTVGALVLLPWLNPFSFGPTSPALQWLVTLAAVAGLLLLGAILSRRAFAVFAAFGICGYLGHLAYDVFEDSLMFPFVLTLLGFAIIGAGLWWQRHEAQLTRRLRALLPQALRELIAHSCCFFKF